MSFEVLKATATLSSFCRNPGEHLHLFCRLASFAQWARKKVLVLFAAGLCADLWILGRACQDISPSWLVIPIALTLFLPLFGVIQLYMCLQEIVALPQRLSAVTGRVGEGAAQLTQRLQSLFHSPKGAWWRGGLEEIKQTLRLADVKGEAKEIGRALTLSLGGAARIGNPAYLLGFSVAVIATFCYILLAIWLAYRAFA